MPKLRGLQVVVAVVVLVALDGELDDDADVCM